MPVLRYMPDSGFSEDELASLMVGREVSFKTDKQAADPKQEVLSLSDVTVKDARGVEAVKQLSLSVRSGEIVGIAGVDGNGQSELIEAITGLRKTNAGTITLNGKQLQNMPPRKVTEAGIGHIPQDRHKHGLVLDFPIGENIVLQSYYQKPYSSFGILNSSMSFLWTNSIAPTSSPRVGWAAIKRSGFLSTSRPIMAFC